jgi:hypothetical protein
MKVSHESPVSILEYSKEYNDFDYCLVHLLHQDAGSPDQLNYYNFYKFNRSLRDREVLLDNSIFELGKSFDPDEFYRSTLDIEPNMFIVPDVLEDSYATIQSFKNFDTKRKDIKNTFQTRAIGAVQGRNWQDLTECYKFMADNADMIAISFDFSYYQVTGQGWHHLERWYTGRQRFIQDLINNGIWRWDKPHHLLGCSLAKEFRFYVDRNIHNIVSCDTSNPIVAAIHGLKYDADYGLDTKPSAKLADLITHKFTDDQLELVKYNTTMFKKIIRR